VTAVRVVVCLDVGSTYTKGAAVDVDAGALLATASHPTTVGTDVLVGVDQVRADLAAQLPGADLSESVACSSAGGGLRLAVIGYERAVTAEAGHRVGLSAGAKIVHVGSGRIGAGGVAALEASRPDVVLLVGGTDGGNSEVLAANARALAGSGLSVPVVVAGNVEARSEVMGILAAAGWPAIAAANVLPRIGVLDPLPARAAIREVFIAHVIGGKHLSASPDFAQMVRAATPDAVLAGVELLADGAPGVRGAGDVVVVDVGGATTDVYSVVTPDPEEAALHREVVEVMWRGRTVEGDLGVRWGAPGVVAAALAERLLDEAEAAVLMPAAEERAADPSLLATDRAGRAVDARLAELAVTVALRRHARPQESGEVRNPGKDLRAIRLVVGSGGVLRHAEPAALQRILAPAVNDYAGGWRVPERASLAVDARYVLAAAGLLAASHPVAAARLVTGALRPLP
jgi:uncharacterized protein (TIGR01319 family)